MRDTHSHRSLVGWLATVAPSIVVTVLLVGSGFFIERRAPDFDPQYARDIAERTIRYGGSYYVNGIHNKGPLEPFVYEVAARITTFDGFWFAIAAMVVCVSCVLAATARRVVRLLEGPTWLGWSAALAVYVHFAVSDADYAGVLYSRNMTVCLLALAFLLVTPVAGWPTSGRRRLARVIVAGACLGLAVQTLLTAALTVGVIGLYALREIPRSRPSRRGPGLIGWFLLAGASAFLSAPVYYRVFGPWRDFWDGWWVYGRYMSAATGRSQWQQLGLGWHEFYLSTQSHAPATIAGVAFVALSISRWHLLSTGQRRLAVLLPAWWAAGWFEIVLTQRYSSHYFVVTSVPLAMMVVGLGVHLTQMFVASGARLRHPRALPYVTLAICLVWSGSSPILAGLRGASGFTSVGALAHDRAVARNGASRSIQAVLDLTSRPDDPLLAWTNYPWPYLDFQRVSATRYIWKSFLMGEIYLGRTSEEYVLPGSWDRWERDVARTAPTAYLTDAVFPVPLDTPAGKALVADFVPMLATPSLSLSLTPAVRDALTERGGDDDWRPAADTLGEGWTFDEGTATYDGGDLDESDAVVDLGALRCRRFDATIVGGGGVSFHFVPVDPAGGGETVEMYVLGTESVSRSPDVDFLHVPVTRTSHDDISLLVGDGSAVLLVNGVVGAALSLLPDSRVEMTSTGDRVTLVDASTGPAPTGGEC